MASGTIEHKLHATAYLRKSLKVVTIVAYSAQRVPGVAEYTVPG